MSKVGIIEYDKLVDGTRLMTGNSNLVSVECPFPKLKVGAYMFLYCSKLQTFVSSLPLLENGEEMFSATGEISSFDIALPNLTNCYHMFGHSNIKSFSSSNLGKLKVGDSMFWGADVETINADFPSLVFGHHMFLGCDKLENFNCNNLGSFITGSDIFDSCKLSAQSVMNIANSIKDVNSLLKNAKVLDAWPTAAEGGDRSLPDGCYKHKTSGQYLYVETIDGEKHISYFGNAGEPGQIHIDVDENMSESDLSILSNALDIMAGKGWSIYSWTIPDTVSISDDGTKSSAVYVEVLYDYFNTPTHKDKDGKPVHMTVVKSIYSAREHNYKLFPSKEEAELYYGLTPIESN